MLLAGALILLTTLTPVNGNEGGCFAGVPCTLGHVLAFAILGVPVALRYATSRAAQRSPARVLLMVLVAIWLFAALDELAQGWVDGREPDLGDWLADMAGAVLGLAIGSLVLRYALSRSR